MSTRTDAIKAAIDATATAEQPTRHQSASMTIGGRLTAVGESFAGIESAGQQITLGINVEQARWLGKYVGGEVKLTLEVTP